LVRSTNSPRRLDEKTVAPSQCVCGVLARDRKATFAFAAIRLAADNFDD
jgi:hypothetical protein